VCCTLRPTFLAQQGMPRLASTPCATSMLQNLHIMPSTSSTPTTPPKTSLPTGCSWGGASLPSLPNSPGGASPPELIPESSAKIRRGQQGQGIGLDEENLPTRSRMRMSKSPSPSAGSSSLADSQTTLLRAIRDPRISALQSERENEAPADMRMPAPAILAAVLRSPSPSNRMRSRLSVSAYPNFGGAPAAAGVSDGGNGSGVCAYGGDGGTISQRFASCGVRGANDAPPSGHFGHITSARPVVCSSPLGCGH